LLPLERMQAIAKGEIPDRVPFVPTIYEHAAALIGVTPSAMARSAELIVKGQLKAYELYGHDLVTVGVDIYNVEAEALGCTVAYNTEEPIVPAIVSHVLEEKATLSRLSLPDPEKDGRMPLLLEAASRIKETLGKEVLVGAAIVGPFTLAALLRGYEALVLDLVMDPGFAGELLDFTTEVSFVFGKAFIKRGVGLSINESWIAPPLLSPQLYAEYVYPRHTRLIERLKMAGAPSIGLISGGNTTAIVDWLVRTGSSILVADYGTDLATYKLKAQAANVILRGNIQATLLETGTEEEIAAQAREVLNLGAPGGRFILGCGVVPYHAVPEKILFLKKIAEEYRWGN